MTAFDFAKAVELIEANKAVLGADKAQQDAALTELKSRLRGRSVDDRKEATKLAVETVKTLITIAVAVLVATGTLVQFARTNGIPWLSPTIALFGLAVVVLFISMWNGLRAISDVYQRAEGRIPDEAIWRTEPVKGKINWQAITGVIGLASLIAGLGVWAFSLGYAPPPAAVSLTIPAAPQSTLAPGPLTIEGIWTELRLRTTANQEIKLPSGSSPIHLTCK